MMRRLLITGVGFVAAALVVALVAPPLGAAPGAPKTSLRIGTLVHGAMGPGSGTAAGTFTLDLGASSDAGKLTVRYSYRLPTTNPEGSFSKLVERVDTLKGKKGTLVIRSTGRQSLVGVVTERDPHGDDEVWTGTWSVVKGTGRYSGINGGGRGVGTVLISSHEFAFDIANRYEGYVTGVR